MGKHSFLPFLRLTAFACLSLLGSCGGGNSANTGTLNLLLTDSPACGYQNVYVSVDHVEISPDGSSWISVPVKSSVQQPVDLLNLTNGILLSLGEAPLAAGTYNQVRLVLKPNGMSAPWANYLVPSGYPTVQIPLKTPSGQQSGYKINGPFHVHAGTMSDLVLDFNACKSIVVAGNSGNYLLKPVVSATAMVVSGSITGTTVPSSLVYAEQQSNNGPVILIGSVADSITGTFTLSPILESSMGGTVDVVVVPPVPVSGVPAVPVSGAGYATDIVQDVPVTAGRTTNLGTFTPASSTINIAAGSVTVAGLPGAANLVANQTVTSSARTYEIASTTTTGTYAISLAASGPWIGTFSPTLPITFTEDTASTDAGIYSIAATDAAGTVSSQSANVSAGPVTINFSIAP